MPRESFKTETVEHFTCFFCDRNAHGSERGNPFGTSLRRQLRGFDPSEMDAPGAIRAGQANTLVVCVSNATLNEVGTGGITGPVMFYAPADGAQAEIRNSRPPEEEFPGY